jgi:hypothetical protein
LWLTLAGLCGAAFFALTDPRLSVWGGSTSSQVVDAVAQASPGTWVGIVGSGVIVLIGLWLTMRRTA